MTLINFDLRAVAATGRVPVDARIRWSPTGRRTDGGVVILPEVHGVKLVDGVASAELDPGYYLFTEVNPAGSSAVRLVPASGPVNYADLVAVNPADLAPLPGPAPFSEVHVGPENGLAGPGLWVETGLGVSGNDFTIWIEDGTP